MSSRHAVCHTYRCRKRARVYTLAGRNGYCHECGARLAALLAASAAARARRREVT